MRPDAKIPSYANDTDAGMDICACVDVTININETCVVPTGIKVAIPEGYEIQVRPRSGLALKRGLTVLNTPGTIDADYRGEIGVIVFNSNRESVTIESYERIAQLVLTPVVRCKWELVDELPVTNRGDGGFNSTGTK